MGEGKGQESSNLTLRSLLVSGILIGGGLWMVCAIIVRKVLTCIIYGIVDGICVRDLAVFWKSILYWVKTRAWYLILHWALCWYLRLSFWCGFRNVWIIVIMILNWLLGECIGLTFDIECVFLASMAYGDVKIVLNRRIGCARSRHYCLRLWVIYLSLSFTR